MTIIQYMISIILLCFGSMTALVNGWHLLRWLAGKSSPSVIPVLGGILLFVGALLFPGGVLKPWAVTGLLLDYGCLPYLFFSTIHLISQTRRYAEKNRILSLRFEANACTGNFFVYPNDECIYKWAAKDMLSSGSMIMKVDQYIPNRTLRLSIQDTGISLGMRNGAWEVESETGWQNPRHSLANATITQIPAH